MYTIRQAAERTGFSPDTLRYYEKIGLLRSPSRGAGEVRRYSEEDVRQALSIQCLKRTGLSLEDIKEFIQEGQCFANRPSDWSDDDLQTLSGRSRILAEHLDRMERQRQALDDLMKQTQEKLDYYNAILDQVDSSIIKEVLPK